MQMIRKMVFAAITYTLLGLGVIALAYAAVDSAIDLRDDINNFWELKDNPLQDLS